MIRTDGRRTIAHRPPKAESSYDRTIRNTDAFIRTRAEIRALPERKS